MEAFESGVEWRHKLRRTVICRDDPNESCGVQANCNIDVSIVPATVERRLSVHIIRVAHTELDRCRRSIDYGDRVLGHVGRHQIRLGPGSMRVVILRGPKTVVDMVQRRYGAVVRIGHVRQLRDGTTNALRRRRRIMDNPVVSVRRHVFRVQQFNGRARVPVDDDMRTAAHLCQGGRGIAAGVLYLSDHVRHHESVPESSGGLIRVVRFHDVWRCVVDDGRLRVFCCTRNTGQKFQRN